MGHGALTRLPAHTERVKAIVFDLDGTLYQEDRLGTQVSDSAIRYVADLKELSEPEAAELLARTRKNDREGGTLSRAVFSLGGTLQEMHRRFAAECTPERLLAPDRRVRELLQLLSTRFHLHLYTNNNRDLSGRIMQQIGVADMLQQVFTIEDYWTPKPDRRIINDILNKIGCRPFEALFVGDRYEVDLALPETMGCPVFEIHTTEELLTLADLVH